MKPSEQLVAIEVLERRLLEPNVRSSRKDLNELLSEDFVEFGRSGRVWTRKEIIAVLLAEPSLDIEIDSVQSRHIGEDVILITYRSRRVDEADGIEALRSSVWQRQGGTWKLTFHQGTDVRR